MKNPYDFFTSDSYTKTELDAIVYEITVSGVTQQQLDDAIATFRTSDQIDTSYSASTANYLTLDEINATGSGYTEDFISSAEIDSRISDYFGDLLTPSEIDVVFSAHTENLVTEAEAQTQIDSAVEVSEDYWHPAPYYERVLVSDSTNYNIGATIGNTVDIILSGNTPWAIHPIVNPPFTSESPDFGTGTTVITLTATQGGQAQPRQSTLRIESDDVAGAPLLLTITQAATGV